MGLGGHQWTPPSPPFGETPGVMLTPDFHKPQLLLRPSFRHRRKDPLTASYWGPHEGKWVNPVPKCLDWILVASIGADRDPVDLAQAPAP